MPKKLIKILSNSILIIVLVSLYAIPAIGHKESTSQLPNMPQVLGANSKLDIRGQEIKLEIATPRQIKEIDESKISAFSYFVMDLNSEEIILKKDADKKHSIASLTKLLTALLVYENLNFESTATVINKDTINATPVLNLIPGDQIKISDLFNAMLIGSCNDAALMLGRILQEKTQTPIAKLMNDKAKELGMDNSQFSNPLGFDSAYNYSTASDLWRVVKITANLPAFIELEHKTSYGFISDNGNSYRARATNKLITKYPDISAIKTGFTGEAQGTMIVKIENNKNPYIIIILGSQSRESDIVNLKDQISQSFSWQN